VPPQHVPLSTLRIRSAPGFISSTVRTASTTCLFYAPSPKGGLRTGAVLTFLRHAWRPHPVPLPRTPDLSHFSLPFNPLPPLLPGPMPLPRRHTWDASTPSDGCPTTHGVGTLAPHIRCPFPATFFILTTCAGRRKQRLSLSYHHFCFPPPAFGTTAVLLHSTILLLVPYTIAAGSFFLYTFYQPATIHLWITIVALYCLATTFLCHSTHLPPGSAFPTVPLTAATLPAPDLSPSYADLPFIHCSPFCKQCAFRLAEFTCSLLLPSLLCISPPHDAG